MITQVINSSRFWFSYSSHSIQAISISVVKLIIVLSGARELLRPFLSFITKCFPAFGSHTEVAGYRLPAWLLIMLIWTWSSFWSLFYKSQHTWLSISWHWVSRRLRYDTRPCYHEFIACSSSYNHFFIFSLRLRNAFSFLCHAVNSGLGGFIHPCMRNRNFLFYIKMKNHVKTQTD